MLGKKKRGRIDKSFRIQCTRSPSDEAFSRVSFSRATKWPPSRYKPSRINANSIFFTEGLLASVAYTSAFNGRRAARVSCGHSSARRRRRNHAKRQCRKKRRRWRLTPTNCEKGEPCDRLTNTNRVNIERSVTKEKRSGRKVRRAATHPGPSGIRFPRPFEPQLVIGGSMSCPLDFSVRGPLAAPSGA